jgi:hypothetical protein
VLTSNPYIDSIVNSTCIDDLTYTFKTVPTGKLSYLSLVPCFKFSTLYPKFAISHSDGSQLSSAFKINDTTGIVEISNEIEYSGKYLVKISAKD